MGAGDGKEVGSPAGMRVRRRERTRSLQDEGRPRAKGMGFTLQTYREEAGKEQSVPWSFY